MATNTTVKDAPITKQETIAASRAIDKFNQKQAAEAFLASVNGQLVYNQRNFDLICANLKELGLEFTERNLRVSYSDLRAQGKLEMVPAPVVPAPEPVPEPETVVPEPSYITEGRRVAVKEAEDRKAGRQRYVEPKSKSKDTLRNMARQITDDFTNVGKSKPTADTKAQWPTLIPYEQMDDQNKRLYRALPASEMRAFVNKLQVSEHRKKYELDSVQE